VQDKTEGIEKGKKVRFEDREDSKDAAHGGSDGLSDMDSDELEELAE
jgi:hypothetical protein